MASLPYSRTKVRFARSGHADLTELFEVPSKYRIDGGLGYGTFGFVASAVDTESNEAVAIKKLRGDLFYHQRLALSAVREIFLLSHFQHKNIIQLKDIFIPVGDIQSIEQLQQQMTSFSNVYIVLAKYDMNLRYLCENMEDLFEDRRKSLSKDERSCLMYQMLCGMKGIHSARVKHRDLKPDNIMISSNFDLAIIDFGSGRVAADPSDPNETPLYQVCTQWYRAPEGTLSALNNDGSLSTPTASDDRSLTEVIKRSCACDVWSIGCIMAEIILRKPLFRAASDEVAGDMNQLEKIFDVMGTPTEEYIRTEISSEDIQRTLLRVKQRTGTFDAIFSERGFPGCEDEIDLLRRMLTFSAEKRITIADALEHEYLKDWHNSHDEPESPEFSLPCDRNVTVAKCRELIWQKMCEKHPEMSELENELRMRWKAQNVD